MKNISLFGTSADPPTIGHQTILQYLSQHFDIVVVWASDNPFKSHQTNLADRSNMLKLLIEELDQTQQKIQFCPELSHHWTIETIARARHKWPDALFTLVIGSDLVSQLPGWYNVKELLQEVKILVISRPGYPLENLDLEPLYQLGAVVKMTNCNAPNVSSTGYRERRDKKNLIPSIEAYIYREKLYSWQNAPLKKMEITTP